MYLFCCFDNVDQSVLLEAVPSVFFSLFVLPFSHALNTYVMPKYHAGVVHCSDMWLGLSQHLLGSPLVPAPKRSPSSQGLP